MVVLHQLYRVIPALAPPQGPHTLQARFAPWRTPSRAPITNDSNAPVAAEVQSNSRPEPDYESGGQEFESLRARHCTILCEIVAGRYTRGALSRR